MFRSLARSISGRYKGSAQAAKSHWAELTERHASLWVADDSIRDFYRNHLNTYAASFAYYAFVSIFPLALLAFAIMGFIFRGKPDLQARAINSLFASLPKFAQSFADALDTVIANRVSLGLVGIIGLLWSGTGFTRALDSGFSIIWRSERSKFWSRRLRGLAVILAVVLVGVAGFVINGLTNTFSSVTALHIIAQIVIALLINWGLFMAVYVIMPRRRIHLREVMVGALVAAVLWYGTQTALQYYVGTLSKSNQIYGILGTALSLLLWLYAGGYIIFYGGQLNRSLYEKAGKEA